MGITSKIKSAAASYAKNVAGGAKIVAGAVSSAAKKAGSSQSANALQATLLPGAKLTPKPVSQPSYKVGDKTYTVSGLKSIGLTPTSPQITSGRVEVIPVSNTNPPKNESGYNVIGGSKVNGSSLKTSTAVSSFSSPTALSVGQFGAQGFSGTPSTPAGTFVASKTNNAPASGTISTGTVRTPITPITLPEEKYNDPTSLIPPIVPITEEKPKEVNPTDVALQSYIDSLNGAPTSEKAYKKAQEESGILNARTEVNNLSAKLNEIVNRGQAQQLSLVGQGRGIPEAIIGGQQAQIGRETAIAALPVQAQLSAAQGNLEMAQDNLDTLFKIYADDARVKYENKKEKAKILWQDATEKEKRLIEKADKLEERAYQAKQENIKAINSIALEVIKNGGGNIIPKLSSIDMASPNAITQAISIAGSRLVTSSTELTDVNGRKALVDKRTGAVKYLDDNSSDIVQRTVGGAPVDGYTLKAGDDPYFIAQKYGTDMNGLKALNPNIVDWNNIQIGATINVPSKTAGVNQALQNILGSAKFTKEQKADLVNGLANGQDPLTIVKNQAKNIMGQTLATNLSKYETAKTQMESIKSMLNKYYQNGGETGIFDGNYEKAINKLGEVSDPKLVEIATNISSALQIYRNAVSGTAYSVQEGKDIASIFPGINKSEGLNNAILAGRLKAFEVTIDSEYRNALGESYDQLKQSTKPPVDPLENIKNYGDANPAIRPVLIQMQKDGRTIEEISNWINQQ